MVCGETCAGNLFIFWPGAAPWHGAGKEDAPAVNLDLCYVVKFAVISLLVVLSLMLLHCLLCLILLLCCCCCADHVW